MLKKIFNAKWLSLIMIVIIALAALIVVLVSKQPTVSSPVAIVKSRATDLTGKWQCDDGGTYYIRQMGDDVMWFGEKTPDWSNVANGTLDDNILILKWKDVPKEKSNGSGVLVLEVSDNDKTLTAKSKTGGFSGTVWHKY
jgi:hypothetical protein